jgi:hypothetical protein
MKTETTIRVIGILALAIGNPLRLGRAYLLLRGLRAANRFHFRV